MKLFYHTLFLPRPPPSVTPRTDALCRVSSTLRVSFRAITLVFVFSSASVLRVRTSSSTAGSALSSSPSPMQPVSPTNPRPDKKLDWRGSPTRRDRSSRAACIPCIGQHYAFRSLLSAGRQTDCGRGHIDLLIVEFDFICVRSGDRSRRRRRSACGEGSDHEHTHRLCHRH
jgi:hypothetical protein